MFGKKKIKNEKRKYYRLKSVMPVDISVLNEEEKELEGKLFHGYSKDVSVGGLKVELKNFDASLIDKLIKKEYKVLLKMELPPDDKTYACMGEVNWVSYDKDKNKYYLGIHYLNIDSNVRSSLYSYAKWQIFKGRFIAGIILFLLFFIGYSTVQIEKLKNRAYKLQQENISSAKVKSFYTAKLEELRKKEVELLKKLKEAEDKLKKLKKMSVEVTKDKEITKEINNLKKEKDDLVSKIESIRKGRIKVRKATIKKDKKKKTLLVKKTINSILGWMKSRQFKYNGLIPSFTGDKELQNIAYSYDEALAVISFCLCKEYQRAKKILDFYYLFAPKDSREKVYYNAYFLSGKPSEYVIHTGPNTWIGIASLQYYLFTGDTRYMQLARRIANWLRKSMDAEGGLKGGPNVSWYSTEHNLDAFAFFDLFYKITGNIDYKQSRDKIFSWLMNHSMDKKLKRFKRGKGDSTIATDTFSWGIAAIGPEKLNESGMDPDAIIKFAEKNCRVKTLFRNTNGQIIEVIGFDFAKARNLPRGGVISTEWTAQMIVAYALLKKYYWEKGDFDKSEKYEEQYDFYINELQKMLIVSTDKRGFSYLCLPYASQPNADTGHGWRTPSGQKTESLSASCYYIFALKKFNPISYIGNEGYYKVKIKIKN